MNRLISWIKRKGDQNSVTYSRFGLPGDETDDRPPPTQIVVAPFDELDEVYMLCKKVHVARAALVCAGLGMAITVCVFIATFFEFNWYSHRRGVDVLALIGLILFLVCGILTHWHVVVGVKKNHPKYLLPFIVVYVCMITAEGAMGVFGIYHYSMLASIEVPDHVFQTRTQASAFKEYHSALTAQVMFATLLFFTIFAIQGTMLWIVLRCRQFLERKMIHSIEMRVAEKAKLQYPNIRIVSAEGGSEYTMANGGAAADVVNVENGNGGSGGGITNPNHVHFEAATLPVTGTPTHRIGIVNESIGTPPPSYARWVKPQSSGGGLDEHDVVVADPHHNHQGGAAAPAVNPTRTLFSSSVE
ncbi:hypothetical protein PFISCL1PPCAC_18255 [Pristionchus fissidentatus]|uniref:Uncharacterized protein n=1 Tax=Pristionchus fissidentatus TaxID=1538716 RepID=A0AAV5W5Z5_9BILA|nr:hypothetical protein PFISCL1PPCAC_18255 [Pristionchus fissidentatus]